MLPHMLPEHEQLYAYKWPLSLEKVRVVIPRRGRNQLDSAESTAGKVGQFLAWLSTKLEELDISFPGNAKCFFDSFFDEFQRPHKPAITPYSCPRLKSLTLECSVFDSSRERWEVINHILNEAGLAARRMPALRMVEIYNNEVRPKSKESGGFHAAGFQYVVKSGSAVAYWRSTWPVQLSHIVQNTWKRVADLHTGYDLEIIQHVSPSRSLPVGSGLVRDSDKGLDKTYSTRGCCKTSIGRVTNHRSAKTLNKWSLP